MKFYKLSSYEPVAQIIADKIISKLSNNQKVFWIVTGGSGIKIGVAVSKLLESQNLTNLSVTLSDERYGLPGHPDSNWQQLLELGFSLPGATVYPVLEGKNLQDTAVDYAQNFADNFTTCDYAIGLFGIGPDGHVAGMLPGSPALKTDQLAVGYTDAEVTIDSPPGVLRDVDRLTMTSLAIAKVNEAIVCAFGEAKHETLDLLEQELPIETQPCQALKQVRTLAIYNDYKGEKI